MDSDWFYPPPPPPPPPVRLPPGTVAMANVPAPIKGNGAILAAVRALWPAEDWAAQRPPTIASLFAIPSASPPLPIPFWDTAVWRAVRESWPAEDWGTQRLLTAGGLTATPQTYQPLEATQSAFLLVRGTWTAEDWPAQSAPKVAALVASAVLPPTTIPQPISQLNTILSWPREDWFAQSESGIASGLAAVQLPPLYIPHSEVPKLTLIRSQWPAEEWTAQHASPPAGWYPPPVTPLPAPLPNVSVRLWPPEDWSAQRAPQGAASFATAPAGAPYVSVAQQMATRGQWPIEDWPAQHQAPAAAIPFKFVKVPYSTQQRQPIALWEAEQWSAQRGPRVAGILATPFVPTPPVPHPIPVLPVINMWPQESWTTQLAGTSAAALALPFVPPITYLQTVQNWGGRVVLSPKVVGERVFVPMDFISRLSVGETILSATVTCAVQSGFDPNPQAMVIGPPGILGTVVEQQVASGTVGTIYDLTFAATTSAGQILELNGYFVVAPNLI